MSVLQVENAKKCYMYLVAVIKDTSEKWILMKHSNA